MGFTFNGITSQSMNIKARLTDWQASPPLRNAFVAIPGKAGVIDFGSDSAERVITVRCNIYPRYSLASLISVLDEMAQWLDPKQGLCRLVLDDIPERYFTARLQDAVDCERLILSAGAFDLRFVCPDPFGYALTDEVFTLSAVGTQTVTRAKGNTESEPIYLLKGIIPSGTSSYITLNTNVGELRIIGALAAGETLVIDSGLVTAKVINSVGETLRNGLPLLSELNFPTLKKGTNTMNISTIGATFTELKIQAKSRWR